MRLNKNNYLFNKKPADKYYFFVHTQEHFFDKKLYYLLETSAGDSIVIDTDVVEPKRRNFIPFKKYKINYESPR